MTRFGNRSEAETVAFTVWFGSFDAWVEKEVLPGIESEALEAADMIVVAAALRWWETESIWANRAM